MTIEPYTFELTPGQIDDLRQRLDRTRWPDALPDSGWNLGTNLDALQGLCRRWQTDFDFQSFLSRCNRFPQFTTEALGQTIRFLHVRSPEPGARPLLLTHGWPGSVAEFWDVLGPLTDPVAHGLDPAGALHVVAPSLPGYGFSGPTTQPGWDIGRVADAFAELMAALGYDRFFCQGGDWGSMVSSEISRRQPSRVAALHLNLLVAPRLKDVPPTEEEEAQIERSSAFLALESAYQQIQGTKPQTLAYGLTDSPAGLAAWILEKFQSWTGAAGLAEFAPDRLLDNLSVYWFTGTINSSMRLYYESIGPRNTGRRQGRPPSDVPTGFACYPGEPFNSPRRWIEAAYDIVRWSDMPRGGHFPAMQVPEDFVAEVSGFFAQRPL
ncbi:MAG TPA: epoxide hydrolase [Acidimicrobiales bacterium]|jgi:microsomal epoxide hydrolase